MKQLFVTHTKKLKKREQRKDIFLCCERKDDKIIHNEKQPVLNIPDSHLPTKINTINSSAISVANTSTDSRKISFQIIPPDQASISTNFSVHSNNVINGPNSNLNCNNNNFLGKKSKIHFDIIKNEDTKTINLNNLNTLSNSSSQSITDSLYSKDLEKSDSLELSEEKNYSYDNINDNTNNLKSDSNNERNNCINAGRWSYEEHIKFIEAIAQYGKNWKEVEKYVGSRTSAQARSHAQKFFLKLLATKNNKFGLDFSNNNIKSLSHIIELIKRKKEYLIQGKEYIINTLISLSETISNDLCKKANKNSKNEKFVNNNLNDNKQLKFDLINEPINNETTKLDSEKTSISEKIEKKNPEKKKKLNENENKDNQKIDDKDIEEKNKEKLDIINEDKVREDNDIRDNKNINNIKRDNLEKEIKELGENNNKVNNINDYKIEEEIQDKEINNNNNIYFEEEDNRKYIFDDGRAFVFDESNFDIFMTNNLSITIKEAFFIKNYKSSKAFNDNYFS